MVNEGQTDERPADLFVWWRSLQGRSAPRSREAAPYDEQNTLYRPIAGSRRSTWRNQAARVPCHQPEGCVPVAPRLRVAVHGTQIGQRYAG